MQMLDTMDATQRVKTPEGYLKVPAVFARDGIQSYSAGQMGLTDRPATDILRVWRPADEVFKAESMASFGGKPVTNGHPSELVTVDNIQALGVGWTGDKVERQGRLMRGTIVLTDATSIRDLDSGKRQLSNGYLAEYEVKSGTNDDGEQYDAIQRDIRGNHVALVERGRCGSVCAVADGEGEPMKTIIIDGKPFEVSSAAADAFAASKTGCCKTEVKPKNVVDAADQDPEGDPEKHEGEGKGGDPKKMFTGKDSVEVLERKLSEARAARDTALDTAMTPEKLQSLVKDRVNVEKIATRLEPALALDELTNDEIRLQVVQKRVKISDSDAKDPAYVRARFEALDEGGGESKRFFENNLSPDARGHKVGDADKPTARQVAMDASAGAWKGDKAS